MAVDITLVIDGIKGETQKSHFESDGGIDLLDWSWNMTQSGTTHTGTGGGSGRCNVGDINFTKKVDLATTDLIKACVTGRHIPKAVLHVQKADGDAQLEYFKVEMKTIIVSSYTTGSGKESDDTVYENLSMNFREFKVVYTQQSETGTKVGDTEAAYDIATNKLV
ncbi:MAG: type VI secretion system tube protein Hcp [Rhodobacteraceae bacterium]|nr:type VI secretion system tube protein Hcp [Paracoccaceae bacterium]